MKGAIKWPNKIAVNRVAREAVSGVLGMCPAQSEVDVWERTEEIQQV